MFGRKKKKSIWEMIKSIGMKAAEFALDNMTFSIKIDGCPAEHLMHGVDLKGVKPKDMVTHVEETVLKELDIDPSKLKGLRVFHTMDVSRATVYVSLKGIDVDKVEAQKVFVNLGFDAFKTCSFTGGDSTPEVEKVSDEEKDKDVTEG